MSIATVRPNYALKAAIERWQHSYPSAPPAPGYTAIPVAPVMQPLLPVQERTVSNRKLKLHIIPCICYLVIIGVIAYMAHDGMFG
jgi:hypothetical protein